jgi:hypothetical protein
LLIEGIFEYYRTSPNFGLLFFHGKSKISFFDKNGLGYNLGVFITNSSGHPEASSPFAANPENENLGPKNSKTQIVSQSDSIFICSVLCPTYCSWL